MLNDFAKEPLAFLDLDDVQVRRGVVRLWGGAQGRMKGRGTTGLRGGERQKEGVREEIALRNAHKKETKGKSSGGGGKVRWQETRMQRRSEMK